MKRWSEGRYIQPPMMAGPPANYPGPGGGGMGLDGNVRKLYRTCADSVRRLDQILKESKNVKTLYLPEVLNVRNRLKDCAERLMFHNPAEFGKRAEEIIWRKCFYEPIQLCRQLKNTMTKQDFAWANLLLNSGIGYYRGLLCRFQMEALSTGQFLLNWCDDFEIQELSWRKKAVEKYDPMKAAKRIWMLESAYKTFLYMGDLARYRSDLNETGDYCQAERFYRIAVQLKPDAGMPHNQLGTLYAGTNFGLDSAYCYLRSVFCNESFPGAEGNFLSILERNEKQYRLIKDNASVHYISRSDDVRKCVILFMHQICVFYQDSTKFNEGGELSGLCEKLLENFEVALLLMPSAVSANSHGVHSERRIIGDPSAKVGYLGSDVLFNMVLMQLLVIKKLQDQGSLKLSAAIALVLSMLSHILNRCILDLQGLLPDLEALYPAPIVQKTSDKVVMNGIANGHADAKYLEQSNVAGSSPHDKPYDDKSTPNHDADPRSGPKRVLQKNSPEISLRSLLRRRRRGSESEDDVASDADSGSDVEPMQFVEKSPQNLPAGSAEDAGKNLSNRIVDAKCQNGDVISGDATSEEKLKLSCAVGGSPDVHSNVSKSSSRSSSLSSASGLFEAENNQDSSPSYLHKNDCQITNKNDLMSSEIDEAAKNSQERTVNHEKAVPSPDRELKRFGVEMVPCPKKSPLIGSNNPERPDCSATREKVYQMTSSGELLQEMDNCGSVDVDETDTNNDDDSRKENSEVDIGNVDSQLIATAAAVEESKVDYSADTKVVNVAALDQKDNVVETADSETLAVCVKPVGNDDPLRQSATGDNDNISLDDTQDVSSCDEVDETENDGDNEEESNEETDAVTGDRLDKRDSDADGCGMNEMGETGADSSSDGKRSVGSGNEADDDEEQDENGNNDENDDAEVVVDENDWNDGVKFVDEGEVEDDNFDIPIGSKNGDGVKFNDDNHGNYDDLNNESSGNSNEGKPFEIDSQEDSVVGDLKSVNGVIDIDADAAEEVISGTDKPLGSQMEAVTETFQDFSIDANDNSPNDVENDPHLDENCAEDDAMGEIDIVDEKSPGNTQKSGKLTRLLSQYEDADDAGLRKENSAAGSSKATKLEATGERLSRLSGDGTLMTVKVMCDWLRCNPNLVLCVAQGSPVVWSRLAEFLNLLPHEDDILDYVTSNSDLARSLSGAIWSPLSDWTQQHPLIEDVYLNGIPILKQIHSTLNFKTQPTDVLVEATIVRLFCIRAFGHYLLRLNTPGFRYDRTRREFIAPYGRTNVENVTSDEQRAENQKNDLMKGLAKLRMQEELDKHEERHWIPVYLVPDTAALSNKIGVIKQLVSTQKFIVVIPLAIIEELDQLKKDSGAVREAIRFLESQMMKGNRYVRAQKPEEKMELPNISDSNIREVAEIISCSGFLAKSFHGGALSTKVAVITSHTSGSQPWSTLQRAVDAAGLKGVVVENIHKFFNRWQTFRKKGG